MIRKILTVLGVVIVVAVLGMSGFVWWKLQPHPDPQPLPPDLIAATTPEGLALLAQADAAADYELLSSNYVSQRLISYCGVASSVAVLNSLGRETDQSSFFTRATNAVRERRQVMFGGMSLPDLGGLLAAHDLQVDLRHADSLSVDEFRAVVANNLSSPDDYLLVNYQREVLGQSRVGHISPIAAYDADTDRVLIMDTASYKYPPTWVELPKLYEAMNTIDGASGKSRGYVEVSE